MKQQTFRVSEQTRSNLSTGAYNKFQSKSDFIRTKLAMASEYVSEFDVDNKVRQDKVDGLRESLRNRKAEDAPIDDIVEELLSTLDEQFAEGRKLEAMFKPEDKVKRQQIPVILSEFRNEQLESLAERFRISKQDVIAAVINHNWNN